MSEIVNRVPLTQSERIDTFDSRPTEYLPTVRKNCPGALEPAFIPLDERLWKIENYEEFLAKRRQLIAEGITDYLDRLVSTSWLLINNPAFIRWLVTSTVE